MADESYEQRAVKCMSCSEQCRDHDVSAFRVLKARNGGLLSSHAFCELSLSYATLFPIDTYLPSNKVRDSCFDGGLAVLDVLPRGRHGSPAGNVARNRIDLIVLCSHRLM